MASVSDKAIAAMKALEAMGAYRSEEVRLSSFAQWTVPSISPAELARAGFYSVGNVDGCSDAVKCTFCLNRVAGWEEGDQPSEAHAALNFECPFAQGEEVGNIPLHSESTKEPREVGQGSATECECKCEIAEAVVKLMDLQPEDGSPVHVHELLT